MFITYSLLIASLKKGNLHSVDDQNVDTRTASDELPSPDALGVNKESRLAQIVNWLRGRDQRGECLIILDECHKAKNLIAKEGQSSCAAPGLWVLHVTALTCGGWVPSIESSCTCLSELPEAPQAGSGSVPCVCVCVSGYKPAYDARMALQSPLMSDVRGIASPSALPCRTSHSDRKSSGHLARSTSQRQSPVQQCHWGIRAQ